MIYSTWGRRQPVFPTLISNRIQPPPPYQFITYEILLLHLGFPFQEIGKKENLKDSKHEKKFQQQDKPKGPPPCHRPEAIPIEQENPPQEILPGQTFFSPYVPNLSYHIASLYRISDQPDIASLPSREIPLGERHPRRKLSECQDRNIRSWTKVQKRIVPTGWKMLKKHRRKGSPDGHRNGTNLSGENSSIGIRP